MQVKIASKNCKQNLQVKFEFKTSKNYKQKLQATIASKIWIQNKANNEATKPKSKSSIFFYQNQPMTQPSAGKNTECEYSPFAKNLIALNGV